MSAGQGKRKGERRVKNEVDSTGRVWFYADGGAYGVKDRRVQERRKGEK